MTDQDRTKPPPGYVVWDEYASSDYVEAGWMFGAVGERSPCALFSDEADATAAAWAHYDQVTADATRQARVEELRWVEGKLQEDLKRSGQTLMSFDSSRALWSVRARLKELETDA